MASKMQELIHKYGEFESLLPEELHKIDFEKLKVLKEEFVHISSEDLETIKNLVKEKNVTLDVNKFRKIDYIIRMAFYLPGDIVQEVHSYFAHWYMSMVTLDMLSYAVIELSSLLINYYDLYLNIATYLYLDSLNSKYHFSTCLSILFLI